MTSVLAPRILGGAGACRVWTERTGVLSASVSWILAARRGKKAHWGCIRRKHCTRPQRDLRLVAMGLLSFPIRASSSAANPAVAVAQLGRRLLQRAGACAPSGETLPRWAAHPGDLVAAFCGFALSDRRTGVRRGSGSATGGSMRCIRRKCRPGPAAHHFELVAVFALVASRCELSCLQFCACVVPEASRGCRSGRVAP